MRNSKTQPTDKVKNFTERKTAPCGKQIDNLCNLLAREKSEKLNYVLLNTNTTMETKIATQKRSLSVYEQNVLLPVLMKGLVAKRDRKSAVTAKEITERLTKHGLKISENGVFRIINYIRTNDLVVGLVAGANGYYVASNKTDLLKYEKRLKSHEDSLKKLRKSIKRQRDAMFATSSLKQVHLF